MKRNGNETKTEGKLFLDDCCTCQWLSRNMRHGCPGIPVRVIPGYPSWLSWDTRHGYLGIPVVVLGYLSWLSWDS